NVDGDITANITINASSVNTGTPGSYAVTYDVSDTAGNIAEQMTRTVNVVEAPNTIPVAHAGPDQVVRGLGSVVTLDGSFSIDDDGDTLSYSWVLTAPAGSAATLSDTQIVNPTFTPDVNGTYIVQLRVNDGDMDSILDTVAILYSSSAEELSGGICLSFDDAYIESWHAARGLFDQYNAKVSFNITWEWVASQDFSRLLDLKNDGHEIASHSLSHLDIDGVITGGGYGDASEVERYIHEEIDPAIELMAAAGLPPVTFAFPYNADNPPYTAALLEKFSFARGDAWVEDGSDITTIDAGYYTCSDHDNNRSHVNGFTGSTSIENLNAAMDHAAATNSVVLIYDHKILDNNSSESYGIKRAKLEAILSKAQEIGLKFYTTIELGKHCSD
ncbi:MAG: DUF5011 domain-containing protein, partial [Sulfurovum sp.]|nr:DUF5011 domain-containing protein [Sulfurovum sp.]